MLLPPGPGHKQAGPPGDGASRAANQTIQSHQRVASLDGRALHWCPWHQQTFTRVADVAVQVGSLYEDRASEAEAASEQQPCPLVFPLFLPALLPVPRLTSR